MVDKFVFDDDIYHLAFDPYTRDAYMDFSLKRQAQLTNNNLPRAWHLSPLVSPPGGVP